MPVRFSEVELRDGTYRFAPLTIAQLEQHEEAITAFLGDPKFSRFRLLVPALADSLRVAHPDMTPERVAAIVDAATFGACVEAMMAVSGLRRAAPGEAVPQPAA